MKLVNLEFADDNTLQLIVDTEEQLNEIIRCFKEKEIIDITMEDESTYVIDPHNINFISIVEIEK